MSNLPKWNLKTMYDAINDPRVERDLTKAANDAKSFASDYENMIKNLQPDGIFTALEKYEEINNLTAKLYVFAFLNYVTNISNQESSSFLQKIKDSLTKITVTLSFFTIQINEITDENFKKIMENEGKISKYKPYLRDVRRFQKHILSKEKEDILIQKDSTGIEQIIRIFDEHLAHLKFNIDSKPVNLSSALEMLSSHDPEKRKQAGLELGRVLDENAWFYSVIFNVIAKNQSVDDGLRDYEKPVSSRNLSNFIEDEVVACLANSVKKRYSSIAHKYYQIKAKLLNKEKIEFYDRNAPINVGEERSYSFDEAKKIVLEAYYDFSQEIGKIAEKFFDEKWIDAEVSEFKMSGAFCHPNAVELNPYVMMSYFGKVRDISTLAHELGHGIHMYLSRNCGILMQNTPLTIAETASLFGEQLVFEKMLKSAISKEDKVAILSQKIEDTINTIVRQISFFDFETKIHEKRKHGELKTEEIGEIWIETQRNSLGDSINLPKEYQNYWAYISHFIHSPFYVYSYAFGNLLVNALFNCYKKEMVSDFSTKYIEMLSSGGKLHHGELLSPFGLNAKDENFWNLGLDLAEDMIKDLELVINS